MLRVGLALLIVVAAAAPVIVWHISPPAWSALEPATCMPDACFCEGLREGVRQPANTWSSFGFVLVAAGLVLTARRSRFVELFIVAAVLLGATSAYYHASLTFLGQWMDVASMYLLVTLLAAHAAASAGWLEPSRVPLALMLANLPLFALSGLWPETRRYLFGIVVVGLFAIEVAVVRKLRIPRVWAWLGGALACFVAAHLVWQADIQGWLCAPESLLQGHAAWHLGCAAAALLLFGAHQRLEERAA